MYALLPVSEVPAIFQSMARATPAQIILFSLICTTVRILVLRVEWSAGRATIAVPRWLFGLACLLAASAVWRFSYLLAALTVALAGVLLLRGSKRVQIAWRQVVQDIAEGLTYTAIFVFMLLRPYVIQTFEIPSPSMSPTLMVGDYLFVDKTAYRLRAPKRGEVAVFKPPIESRTVSGGPDELYVKRVIGIPGDVVEVIGGVLYRNDVPIVEPYVADRHFGEFKLVKYHGELLPIVRGENGQFPQESLYVARVPPKDLLRVWTLPPEPIPEGMYLVLGDNRNNSVDSRYWGLVKREDMVGRVWLRFFPLTRAGLVR